MSAQPRQTSDVIGLTKVAPFSRRGFMTASAAVTAGYTLAAGPVRADVIKTDTDGLTAGDAKIKVADGVRPAGQCDRSAGRAGGDGNLRPAARASISPRSPTFRNSCRWSTPSRTPNCSPISTVRSPGPSPQGGDTGRLGTIGFCRGGRTVWEYAAHNSTLKAGVAFYGPPVDPPNPLWPKSPTELAPDIKALKAALAAAHKTAEFKIYPGAPHGFHADYRSSYRQDAAEDAWNQMQPWLRKYKVLS